MTSFSIIVLFSLLCSVIGDTSKEVIGSLVKNDFEACLVSETCPLFDSKDPKYDHVTGFTNFTGWFSSTSSSRPTQCCNICSPNYKNKEQAGKGTAVRNQKQMLGITPGVYDYLIFDQIWLPQFCGALAEGHDPTLSHPAGSVCTASVQTTANNRLSIHGVWPSAFDGTFLSCCIGETGSDNILPVNPIAMAQWDIFPAMLTDWIDPVGDKVADLPEVDVPCSTCFLYNHEWQKHGTCYADGSQAQYSFFDAGLSMSKAVQAISEKFKAFAGQTIELSTLQALYPASATIVCDPNDAYESKQVFLEVRTCWNATSHIGDLYAETAEGIKLGLLDCPSESKQLGNPNFANVFSSPCVDGPVYFREF